MNKFIKYALFALISGCAITSCEKPLENTTPVEPVEPEVTDGKFEIIASAATTKTTNSGNSTLWAEGDALSISHVVSGTTDFKNDGQFTVSNIEAGVFTGQLSQPLAAESHDWYAIYPYQEGNEFILGSASDQSQKQTGINSKTHVAGPTYPISGKVMNVPKADKPSMAMLHLSCLVELTLKNSSSQPFNVNSIEFTAPEDIVGTYQINWTAEAPDFIAKEGAVSKTAKLEVTNGEIPAGQSATFYFAVKPFTAVSGNTLTLSVNGMARSINVEAEDIYKSGEIHKLGYELQNGIILNATPSDIVLDYAEKDTKAVEFNWSAIGVTADKFTLSLSLNEDMSKAVETEIQNHKLTHAQLQSMLEQLEGYKRYAPNKVWWNIKAGDILAKKPLSFNLTEMMVLKDVRGDETQVYKVVRLNYPNGKSVVWTAENLRATKYNDGTDIGPDKCLDANDALFTRDMSENVEVESYEVSVEKRNACGNYYDFHIDKQKLAAKGWKIPSKAEWQEVFTQSKEAFPNDNAYAVLKDEKFYCEEISKKENVNAWGLSLCTAGEWQWWMGGVAKTRVVQEGTVYAYYLYDSNENYLLHDGGPTLWTCSRIGTAARMIMVE